jgi:four helix bundle protein
MQTVNTTNVRSHKSLLVWQKGMLLAEMAYGHARAFPKAEAYGLTSQLTRAAISVPCNIAEGHARGTTKEYCHFLSVARGSLAETETLLLLALRVGYVVQDDIRPTLNLIDEIGKILNAIRSKLKEE